MSGLIELVRGAIRSRLIRRVMLAYAAFGISEYAVWIAMLVYAFDRGGSRLAGIVAVAQLVPAALVAPVAASFADRGSPGLVLVGGYLVQGGAMIATGVAMHANAALAAYGAAVLASTAVVVTRPAQAALLPALARTTEELTAANALTGWVDSASVMLAGAIAGVLLATVGTASVFLACGALALGAALLVGPTTKVRPLAVAEEERATEAALAGLRIVARDATPRLLTSLLAAEFLAIGALDILFVVLAVDVLHRGQGWVGWLNFTYGLGGVAVGIGCAALAGRRRLLPAIAVGAGVFSMCIVANVLSPGAVVVVVLLAAAGGGRVLFDVATRLLLQRVVPADVVGRVFGAVEGLTMAGLALGSVLTPVLIGLWGINAAIIGVGLIFPLVFAIGGRQLARVDATVRVPIVEIALLRSLPSFRLLPAPALESLAHSVRTVPLGPGGALIRQGDDGDEGYAIIDGLFDVAVDACHVASLGRGDLVGEIALLHDVPRTATVTATTKGSVLAFERDAFLTALVGHAPTREATDRAVRHRLGELDLLQDASDAPN